MWQTPSQRRLDAIPRLYETEKIPLRDKLIYLHFYIFNSHWFACEFDGVDRFFGFAMLNNDDINAEWGYFSFSELKSITIYSTQICCEPEESWLIRPASEVEHIRV
nr:DUF2958 domain-containing protein [uncultured Desulfobacter sp.]